VGEASDVPEVENELNSGGALQLFKFSSRSIDTGHLRMFMEIVAARQFSRTMEENQNIIIEKISKVIK